MKKDLNYQLQTRDGVKDFLSIRNHFSVPLNNKKLNNKYSWVPL